MSAPAERDDEPTGRFVPLWDDEVDEVVDLPERVIVVREPAASATDPAPLPTPEPLPRPAPLPRPEPGPLPTPRPGPPPIPEPGPTPIPEPGPTPLPEPGPTPLPEPGPTPRPVPPPMPEPRPIPEPRRAAAPEAERERAGPDALRSVAPEPVTWRPARPSAGRRAVAKVRAASGLLVLVLLSGVLLAAAIGLTVAALAFALRSAVGSG